MNNRFKITIAGLIAIIAFGGAATALAATNISSPDSDRHAWNDVIGWIDFFGSNTVTVTDSKVEGYTNDVPSGSVYGNIALDCMTSPNINVCDVPLGTGNWWVSNDGNGNLAGWAWSDAVGWISFCGTSPGGSSNGGSTWNGSTWVCPGSPTYQVTINPSTGVFSGWAWNDVVGWISFNCTNVLGTCGNNYRVVTSWRGGPPAPIGGGGTPSGFDQDSWLVSSTFNTQVTGGAAFNTISWQGALNAGRVGFQISTSNCSNGATNAPACTTNPGTWNFTGYDNTAGTVYETAGPNIQLPLNQAAALKRNHNNTQYVRYKVWLSWTSQSPQVDDVIVSYSP